MLAAGFPPTTASNAVNRMCSSGLLAIQNISTAISSGCIEVGIAAGSESMSFNKDGKRLPLSESIGSLEIVKTAMRPVGWTSENVAAKYSLTRAALDNFAAESYQKAEKAQKAGWFDEEITPITTKWIDPKTKQTTTITVSQDDGIRYGTTKESLSKIKAAFPQWQPGFTTAGNASQVTDGAAAVLLMKRSTAIRLQQPILGKYVLSTSVGLDPSIMGIGPVYSIPKLLGKLGLGTDDVDIFEINEAFATAVSVFFFHSYY